MHAVLRGPSAPPTRLTGALHIRTAAGPKPLFHPNVYPSGKICLSLLDPEKGWKPSLTIKHLLVGIQTLLDDPNNLDPAQEEPFRAFKHNKAEYEQKVKAQVVILRQNAL